MLESEFYIDIDLVLGPMRWDRESDPEFIREGDPDGKSKGNRSATLEKS